MDSFVTNLSILRGKPLKKKDRRVTWANIPVTNKKPWGNPKKFVSNPFGMQFLCLLRLNICRNYLISPVKAILVTFTRFTKLGL